MRRGFEDDGSGSGSEEQLTDAQKEVQAFKNDRKRQKQHQRDSVSRL